MLERLKPICLWCTHAGLIGGTIEFCLIDNQQTTREMSCAVWQNFKSNRPLLAELSAHEKAKLIEKKLLAEDEC